MSCTSTRVEDAMDKVKGGMSDLDVKMEDLRAALEQEIEDINRGREKLEQDRLRFAEESKRIHKVMNESEQVRLNVGGKQFTTTLTTLRNAPSPSLFNAMFSGRHDLKPDKNGCYFIDRDGRHFHDILNYLRDGSFLCPKETVDFKYLLELKSEAEYYGLCGLVAKIDRYPYAMTRVVRAAQLNTTDSWMYEDGQDEIVFSVDRECQLLGAGLCGTEGGFTVELELLEVAHDDFSAEVTSITDVAQSFTKADGSLLRMFFDGPAKLLPGKFYMLSALIKGSESSCCEDCMDSVVASGVRVTFHVWESPNGTNELRGQFPELYVRVLN
ncbi:unnamed protein product [Ostreobium quekettii]|uniref:BTB domain-containing protein n=1 Tax=Ostreobium quekettii TaxID=121088 RepID=A0A8S1IT47_9CHLO|nr:unnamed protein product [Ostreobium quekettii]|eukprot:evm.model.scf_840.3 EVM.evm.TU.scf_840.3   scf_840:25386-26725(+)